MNKKITQKQLNKQKELEKTQKLKQQYFEYYDDIKSHTHDVYDW